MARHRISFESTLRITDKLNVSMMKNVCPSAEEWIKKLWYIYTMKYYLAIKNKEILSFLTAWIDLETIMLRDISQSQKDKYHMISFIYEI